MIIKGKERNLAINLRKDGFSYSEILEKIPVAKSTLSLWLRSVGLSKRQRQRLTEKKLASIKRGWEKWHQTRLNLVKKIKNNARNEIGIINKRNLWLIGIALYWAEGSKEKEASIGNGVIFANSDPQMISLFLKWLREIFGLSDEQLGFEIYIHENSKNNLDDVLRYWSKIVSVGTEGFKVYFKKNKIKTNRRNVGENYFGLLRIRVKKSSHLIRRISGWVEGICNNCGVVQR